MQHRANHRHGKEALQITMTVPVEYCHRIPGLDAGGGQGIGQPTDPLVESLVAVTQLVGIDDLLCGLVANPRQQQALDQQPIAVCTFSWRNDFCLHDGLTRTL
ncbi:hypothetical protein D3C80_1970040 [compost metagenome]